MPSSRHFRNASSLALPILPRRAQTNPVPPEQDEHCLHPLCETTPALPSPRRFSGIHAAPVASLPSFGPAHLPCLSRPNLAQPHLAKLRRRFPDRIQPFLPWRVLTEIDFANRVQPRSCQFPTNLAGIRLPCQTVLKLAPPRLAFARRNLPSHDRPELFRTRPCLPCLCFAAARQISPILASPSVPALPCRPFAGSSLLLSLANPTMPAVPISRHARSSFA